MTSLILIPSMASSYPSSDNHTIYHYSPVVRRTSTHPLDVQLPTLSGIIIPPLDGLAYHSGKRQHMKPQLDRIITKPLNIDPPISDHKPCYSSSPSTDSSMDILLTAMPFSELSAREDMFAVDTSFPVQCGDISSFSSSHPDPEQTMPFGNADEDDEIDAEDAWNLVPYNIAWGPSYYGYKKGTLPGPDGKSIFLRSPTPLKNQRTGQACEKCRERKAKCSGSRPSCARCIARGHICEYGPELKKAKHSDSETSDYGEDDEDEEDSEQTILDTQTSIATSSTASTKSARPANTMVKKRRNTESGPLPAQRTHRHPEIRRNSVLYSSRSATTPVPVKKKRRIASVSPRQRSSPNPEYNSLKTPDVSCMPSPFSDYSDAGSFFSSPSYSISSVSSPLTPPGVPTEPFSARGSYLTVPSFGAITGSALEANTSIEQGLSYPLDSHSLHVVDASQFEAFNYSTSGNAFYDLSKTTTPFLNDMRRSSNSDSPAVLRGRHYRSNFVENMSQISLEAPSLDSNYLGGGLCLENTDQQAYSDSGIPHLEITDFDSSTSCLWQSQTIDRPEVFDELAFLSQLAQLPASIFESQ